jgi:hypothetical protein
MVLDPVPLISPHNHGAAVNVPDPAEIESELEGDFEEESGGERARSRVVSSMLRRESLAAKLCLRQKSKGLALHWDVKLRQLASQGFFWEEVACHCLVQIREQYNSTTSDVGRQAQLYSVSSQAS